MHAATHVVLVGLGGALGALLRWGVGLLCGRCFGTAFPWGTFFINVVGSFFLGWFSTLLTDRIIGNGGGWLRADELRLFVAVGFTGAFTTFSTYEYEAQQLFNDGDHVKAIGYLGGSVVLGLLAVRLGVWLARLGRAAS
ncbi:MAG: fluoride efflux transporter CrcB [Gemmataceae bacterium]|nr:fluoride efflux transporter CrcB [Gemmataceae bacterium]